MSKRILSFLLALVMVAGLLPALNLESEAASSPTLYLGGVQMYDGDYLLVGATATTTTKPTSTATGYAYYKDSTLQLYNYSYEGSGINFKYNDLTFPVALYCNDDLTIELKGGVNRLTQNKDVQRATAIYVSGDITFIGDHDLDIVSTYSGIYANLGNVIIDLGSGEITIESARFGIQSNERQLSINGGELIVKTTDNSVDADAYAIYVDGGVAIGNKMLIKASTNENAAFSELGVFDPDDVEKYDFIRVRYAAPQKVYANATGLTYDSTKGGYAPNFETFNVTLENANTVTDLSDGYSILYETKSNYTYSNPLTGDPKLGQTYYGYVDIRSYNWSYDVVPENCKIQIPGFDVTVTGCTVREMSSYLRIDYTATYRVEPVYVGGVMMNDGNYLAVGASAVTTAKPSGGYAYYKDNVLTLHNYVYSGSGYAITSNTHYAAIHSKGDLNMVLEGTNSLAVTSGTYTYGIDAEKALKISAAAGASLKFDVGNGTIMSGGNLSISGGTYIQERNCGSMFSADGTVSFTGCTIMNKNADSVIDNYGEAITLTNCNVTVQSAGHFIVVDSASPKDITISGCSIQSTTWGSFVTGTKTGVALTISNADVDASVTSSSYKLFAPDYYNKGGLKSLTVNGKTAIASKDMGATWEVYNAGNLNAYQKLKISSDPFDINVTGIGMMDGQYLANGASAATTTKPSTGGYAYYKDGVLTLNNFNYSGNYNDCMIESYNAINLVLVGKNTLASTGADSDGVESYDGSVNISGAGSLNISAAYDAIFADGNVTVTDATVTINGVVYGIYAYGNVTLDNATVTVKDVECDGIYAEYSAEIKDSTVNIACGEDGINAYDDLAVTGSTVTVNTDDDGLCAGNVTITGSTITANTTDAGIYAYDVAIITGSTVTACGDWTGIYGNSGIFITDSDVIAKCTATEFDGDLWAIYVKNGSVNIDSDLKVQASTEPNGTLGTYDPAKHKTYDYIKITRQTLNAPTLKASNVASTGKIKLSWNKVDGAAKYEIYRATSKTGTYTKLSTVTGTSATNTKTDAGKTYYYKIRAIDANGNKSKYSNVVSRTCDLPQPTVTVTNVASTGKIKLSWNKIEGAAKYQIVRSLDKTNWEHLSYTTGTSATNTKTDAGKTYYYKVRAVHSTSAATSAYSAVVSRTCDLPQVTGLKATNVTSTGKIKLSWNKVDGAAKYQIVRSLDKVNWEHLAYSTGTSATNTKTDAGKTYYYKVRAIHSSSAANSAYSAVVSRTCDLAQPTLTVKLNSNGKPTLSWNAITGAVKYQIMRSTDNKNWEHLAYSTGTSATNTKAVAGTKYYYKIRAIHSNTDANSAYSAVKYITAK